MILIRKLPFKRDKNGNLQSYAIFWCESCESEVEKHLQAGLKAKSCGCIKGKLISKSLLGHTRSLKHGESKTKLYGVWANIKDRCLNIKNHAFKDYGGRGITICPEWANDYTKFRDWSLNNGYQEGLEIDRIDNDGNYEPNNCRWISCLENNRNRRNIKLSLEKSNEIRFLQNLSIKELADKFNVSKRQIQRILQNKQWKN